MKRYPKNKPGYVIIRDGDKNFVAHIPGDELADHISESKADYEFQAFDGTKWTPLIDLVPSGGEHEKRARAALKRMSPDALLIQSSKEGDYELIKWTLAEGADIHAQDDRPLYFAVLHEHERCVQLLMNRGANAAAGGIVAVALRNGNKNILESFSIMEDVSVIDALEAPVPSRAISQEVSSTRAFAGFKCPNCGQLTGVRMDARQRGSAFAGGSLLGAFVKTYRCTSCEYLW